MKADWLEKYAEDGLIRREVLNNIYADMESITKTAGKPEGELVSALLGALAFTGAGAVPEIIGSLIASKRAKSKDLANITQMLKNRELIAGAFEDPNKAKARFDEIASIAPHVAMNTPLMKRMLASRIESGLTDDDVQSLALLQAHYMPDVFKTMSMAPKTASVRPEVLGNILADVYIIKTASKAGALESIGERLWKYMKYVGGTAAIPLTLAATVGGVSVVAHKLQQNKLKEELEKSFRKAVALSDPDKEPLHKEKEKARQAFEALAHFAPHVALQPQAARSFMSKIVNYDMSMNISDIKDLSEIQKNLQDKNKVDPFIWGAGAATKMTATPNIIQDSMRGASEAWITPGLSEEVPRGKK